MASTSRSSCLLIHLAFGCLIVLSLNLPVWIVRDYLLLCVTVLDCPWLHQTVVCQVCRAIMRNFDRSIGRLVPWPYLCKLFLTISSSICKRSKTKSTLLINFTLASNHPPWVYLRAWTAEPSKITLLPPMAFICSLRFSIYHHWFSVTLNYRRFFSTLPLLARKRLICI